MKKAVSLTLITSLICFASYLLFEPEIIKAGEDTLTVSLTVTGGISITAASDITMDSAITMTQATSTGCSWTPWNVKCNDTDGWTLTIKASQAPALQSGTDQIDDWWLATSTPWHATDTAAFGFSVFGDDIDTNSWGNDTTCTGTSSGVPSTNLAWRGFNSTNEINLITSNTTTSDAGSNTYLCVVAEQNEMYIADGAYTATITATATQQ